MNTFMAKGVISDKSERHLQTIGIKEADHAQIAMKEADLVVAIGYDLVEYNPKNWNKDLKKKSFISILLMLKSIYITLLCLKLLQISNTL